MKTRLGKRITSFFLCLAMCLTLLPSTVFAEENIEAYSEEEIMILTEAETYQRTDNVMMLNESNIYDAIPRNWTGYQDGSSNGESVRRTVYMSLLDINSVGEFHAEKSVYQNDAKMCSYFIRGALDQDGNYSETFMFYVYNPNQWGQPSDYSGTFDFSTKTISGTNSNGVFSYSGTKGTNAIYLEKIKSNANDYSKVPANWIGYQDGSKGTTSVRRKVEMKIHSVDGSGNFIAEKTVTGESGSVNYYVNGKIGADGTYSDLFKIYSSNPDDWNEQSAFSGVVYDNLKCIQGKTEWGDYFYVKEGDDYAEYVSNLGFTLGVDNNNFVHTSSSTWSGAGFVGVTDYTIGDEYFNRLTANSTKSEKNKIKKQMKQKWEGSCYGIAMSMGLLYEKYIGIDDLTDEKTAKNYHSMSYPCNNDKLLNMINYYQLSQNLENGGKKTSAVSVAYNNGLFTGLVNWACSYDSLSVCLKKLVNYSSSNHVELLGFSTSSGGHAVLVTGCEYDEDTEQYKVQIYDENSVDSATSKGVFSYMNISKDFSSFSYTDSNGDLINNKTYVAIYFLDWNSLGNIVSTATKTSSGHAKLDFLLGDDFKAINDDGEYIQYRNNEFTGDMNIYSFDTVDSDDGTHIIIETDKTDKLTLSDTGTKVNVEVYNDSQFLALDGENISGAVMDLGDGIKISGGEYTFKAYISTDEIQDNEVGLISISAKASADTTVSKDNSDIVVSSTNILTDIESENYSGTDVDVTTYSDSSEISVKAEEKKDAAIEQITLNKTSISMNVNDTFALVAGVQPSTITNYTLKWKSSDTKVATVTDDGVVKGVAAGTATITVESNGVSAQCLVTVRKNSDSVNSNEKQDGDNNISDDGQTYSSKTSIKAAKITLQKSVYTYDGKKKQPAVNVKIGNTTLTKDVQYKVTYKNNKNIGKGSIAIIGIGNYEGTVSKGFTIVPKGTSISKLSANKKGFVVSWKKQKKNTSGYQIQYSTSKKFTSKTTKTKSITKPKNTKVTISKLKGKRKYYVRVRTYKTVKGEKYYSSWSKIKTVTTKK